MSKRTGSLSINSENIFPIIKKWLYSDHDIFVRELISNGCDAITKLAKLEMMGEYDISRTDYKKEIQVIVNPEEKTLKFIDNGLGMTADEVEEYITQIAFSGATDFLNKYKDKTNERRDHRSLRSGLLLRIHGSGRGTHRYPLLSEGRKAGTLGVRRRH